MTNEEVVEYDPKVWNEYPKVMPPEEGWYRIQYEVECVGYVRRVVYWNGKEWETHHLFVEKFAFGFKPWDDDGGCFQIGKKRVNHSVEKIELTIEEAKNLRLLCSWVMETGLNRKNLKSLEEHHDLLAERIVKAEGK